MYVNFGYVYFFLTCCDLEKDFNGSFSARQRLPGLLKESPTDGEIARQVKHAANCLDRFRYQDSQ